MFGESVGSLSEQLKKAKQAKEARKEESRAIRAEYVQDIKSPFEYREELKTKSSPKIEAPLSEESEELVKHRRIATPKPSLHVYPERVFDQFERKTTWLRGEDIDVLKAMASEIMSGRKRAQVDTNGMNRVTDNNIIRLLVQTFCEKVNEGMHSTDFSKIQSDGEIKNYIENVMRF